MRVSSIRAETEAALKQHGFKADSFMWIAGPNALVISVGGKLKKVVLPGRRTSREKFNRALGRIEGWADMAAGV